MQVSASNHTYANQVGSYYRNERYFTANPIGMSSEVSEEMISTKSNDFQNYLSKFDLHNINPNELAHLATYLFESGEISLNAATGMIAAARYQTDQTTPIDAIKILEEEYARVDSLAENDSTLKEARKLYGDTLHTIYNLDNFIQGTRQNIGIDIQA